MSNFQKWILAFAWVICCLIGYYFLVALPQHNAEIAELKRQEIQIEQDKQQREQQQKEEENLAKIKQEKEKILIEKQNNCEKRSAELKKEFNNVSYVYYNEVWEECYVKYYDDDWVLQETAISNWAAKKKAKPLQWYQTIKYWVNLRETPWISWKLIQKIDPTNVVDIQYHTTVWDDIRYRVKFYDVYWRISYLAFED